MILNPISQNREWGFMVFRPDEHDVQDLCNHENTKDLKHERKLTPGPW